LRRPRRCRSSGPDRLRPAPIGVSAPFSELAQWEEAARVADKALYAAKAGGRNRVVLQLV
jgi:PleD family two-component response regulator